MDRTADPHARLGALAALADTLDRSDPPEAPGRALAAVAEELGLRAGWIFLHHADDGKGRRGTFDPIAWHGLPPGLAGEEVRPLRCGGCECQSRFQDGRLQRGVNMVTCSRLAAATDDTEGLTQHASVPLLGRAGALGILNLAAKGDRRFTSDELAFLEVVGRQLGAAIERERLAAARTEAARFGAALEERQRLASDMHDALSQLLFTAGLHLAMARRTQEPALDEAERLLSDARRELRALIEASRSPDLSAGLVAALERLAARMAPVARVRIIGAQMDLPEAAEAVLYRCAQEAVHNAVRHGGARRVDVSLRPEPTGDAAVLRIADDGSGTDPDRAREGAGLQGLEARARAAGGEMRFERGEEAGMVLTVRLPLTA